MKEFIFSEDITKYMTFKEAVWQLTNDFQVNHPKDLYRFYLNMEKLFQYYNESNPIIIPTQDGGYFTFSYCKKGCLLSQTNIAGDSIDLVTENILGDEEKSILLRIMKQASFTTYIGNRFPDALSNFMMNEIEQGDVFTFSDGQSYLCVDAKPVLKTIQPICKSSDFTKVGLDDFYKEYSSFTINPFDPDQMQSFYNYIKDKTTGNVIPMFLRNATISTGRYLKNIEYELQHSKESTGIYILGKETFHVQYKQDKLFWYDNNKRLVPTNIIKNYIAWLKTSPLKIKMYDNRKISTFIKDATASNFYGQLQEHLSSGDANKIGSYIMDFCNTYKDSVSVKISSYIDENKYSYTAKEFIFKYKEDRLHIYEAIHENNDLSKEPCQFVETSLLTFTDFCEAKLLRQKEVIRLQKLEEILERCKKHIPFSSDSIYRMTENMVIKEKESYAPFTPSDVTELDKDIDQLLNSF